jgi:hypothetical protein
VSVDDGDPVRVVASVGDWEVGISRQAVGPDNYYSRVMTQLGPASWEYIESGDGKILNDALIRVAVLTDRLVTVLDTIATGGD